MEILPACADQEITVCPYSPLGGGLLTGKYLDGRVGRLREDRTYAARYSQPLMHDTACELSALSQRIAFPTATLAVAWVARRPAVTATLISARNVVQLQASLEAMTLNLSDELYSELSSLSPTPAPATDRIEEA